MSEKRKPNTDLFNPRKKYTKEELEKLPKDIEPKEAVKDYHMTEKQINQYGNNVVRKEQGSSAGKTFKTEAKEELKQSKKTAPTFKTVDGVTVQTNTDTERSDVVPKLDESSSVKNYTDKPMAEHTTQSTFAEEAKKNEEETGEPMSDVAQTQIEEVWGKQEGEGVEKTPEEEAQIEYNEKGEVEEVSDKFEEQVKKQTRALYGGIIGDYLQGKFGEPYTAQALNTMAYYLSDKISTLCANWANVYFGRPLSKSAWDELLTKQAQDLAEEAHTVRMGKAEAESAKEKGAEASGMTKEELYGNFMYQLANTPATEQSTWARSLDRQSFNNFMDLVKEGDVENLKKLLLENSKIVAELKLDQKKAELMAKEIVRAEKENHYIDAHNVIGLFNEGAEALDKGISLLRKGK